MSECDPYANLPLIDRLQMLAFEAELAYLPRSLISAIWETIDLLDATYGSQQGRGSRSDAS